MPLERKVIPFDALFPLSLLAVVPTWWWWAIWDMGMRET